MKRFYLLAFIILLVGSGYAIPARFIIRLPHHETALAANLELRGYDIASVRPGEYIDLVVDHQTYDLLKIQYPNARIIFTEDELKANLQKERDIPGYQSYAQVMQVIADWQAQYPNLLRVVNLGNSWGKIYSQQGISYYNPYNHDIIAVMLSDNATIDEDEPGFYFMGAHHAREPISTEVCMHILGSLLAGYGTDPEVTEMVNESEIWFVPIVNPDGHKIVLDQTDVWWRKNIRDNNNNQTFNNDEYGYGTDGVDLNRNYGFRWGYVGATSDNMYPTYHGPSPMSEPEVQAVETLIQDRHFLAGISYHSYGEMVLYPFGFVGSLYAPDQAEMSALAQSMASSIPKEGAGTYDPMPSWQLYPAAGNTDDWAYGNFGIFSYTIELATQFIPTAQQVPIITQNNLEAAKRLIQRQNSKTLKGHVYDAETMLPVLATIFVDGIDDHPLYRAPYQSNSTFGSYYRFLPVGTHTVHYLAPGYLRQSMNLAISNNTATIQDVYLIRGETFDLSIFLVDENGFVVDNASIEFVGTDIPIQSSDAQGIVHIAEFLGGAYRLRISKAGYESYDVFHNIQTPNLIITFVGTPMLSEGFENGIQNWTRTGSWNTTSSQSNSGQFSLADSPNGSYSANGSSYCQYAQPISLSGALWANMQFWIKHNIRQDGDHLLLQYSLNGQLWQSLDTFDGVMDWTLKTYDLSSFGGSSIYIRFQLNTTSNLNADGVYIDDFKVFVNSYPSHEDDSPIPISNIVAYPNPFSRQIAFSIPKTLQKVARKLSIYNVRGQLVKELDFAKDSDSIVLWDGLSDTNTQSSSGIYFLRVETDFGKSITKKILRY